MRALELLQQRGRRRSPDRSASSSGPRGQLKPSRIAVSMSAGEPTFSSSAKAASSATWAKRRRRISGPEGRAAPRRRGRASAPRARAQGRARAPGHPRTRRSRAALAAQPAFPDQLLLNRVGPPALRLPALGEEGAGDAEVDVEADQVDQLEGAHAKAAADRRTRSIAAASATPSPSIRSDSSEKGRARRLAMKPGVSLARIGVRPIRSPASAAAASASSAESAGDHLDQLHQRRRVEEVHADDALGGGAGGDLPDRQGGGVGGENCLRAADLSQRREQLALQLHVLRAPRSPGRNRPGRRGGARR